jgi:hypothetical protein
MIQWLNDGLSKTSNHNVTMFGLFRYYSCSSVFLLLKRPQTLQSSRPKLWNHHATSPNIRFRLILVRQVTRFVFCCVGDVYCPPKISKTSREVIALLRFPNRCRCIWSSLFEKFFVKMGGTHFTS